MQASVTNAPVRGYALRDYLTDYTLTLAILAWQPSYNRYRRSIERLEGTKATKDARRLFRADEPVLLSCPISKSEQ